MRQETLCKLEDQNCQNEDSATTSYQGAFECLSAYVQNEIISSAKVITMSQLQERFVNNLNERGVEARNYRSSKLKVRLQRHFGNKLSFKQPITQNQPELVYYSGVQKGDIVETIATNLVSSAENERMSDAPGDSLEVQDTASYQIYHASKLLRSLLLEMKPSMPWPPSPQDLDDGSSIVPDLLYNMFAWMISSKEDYSEKRISDGSLDVHRLVLSLSQDVIHCVSRGRIKTPKHVALPLTVKSLTGSAETVTILNRFGHGLSYTQIEELETALAERELERQREGVLLPSVCSSGVPGVFCWDNNDLQEETLSGQYYTLQSLTFGTSKQCYI